MFYFRFVPVVEPFSKTRLPTWSGRRGSNSRPLAWKANALSTELLPQKRTVSELPPQSTTNKRLALEPPVHQDHPLGPALFKERDSLMRPFV